MFVCIHKHYSIDEWKLFAKNHPEVLPNIACSSGTSDVDFEKIQQILDAIPEVTTICLDIANGYSEHFVAYVRKVKYFFYFNNRNCFQRFARDSQHTLLLLVMLLLVKWSKN